MSETATNSKAIKQALERHYGKGNVRVQNAKGAGMYLRFWVTIRNSEIAPTFTNYDTTANKETRDAVKKLAKEAAPEATLSDIAFFDDEDWAARRAGTGIF